MKYDKIGYKKRMLIITPGLLIMSIIIWFVFHNAKCDNLLSKDDTIFETVYSYYSKDHILGNGTRAISTGFTLNYEGRSYKITTKKFSKTIPNGTPIIVRFSPKCPDCNEILWDSIFVHDNLKYKYFYLSDKGYNYETTKLK